MSPASIQYICEESGNCLVLSHATYHCISFEAKGSHFCSILLLHKIPSVLPNYVLLLYKLISVILSSYTLCILSSNDYFYIQASNT